MSEQQQRRGQSTSRLSFSERGAVIRAAATEVFAARGYDQASMRKIARTAGITTPGLYDHFKSKTDLYISVVQHHAGALISHWADPADATTMEELFHRTTEVFFSWIADNEAGWRILFLDKPADQAAKDVHDQVERMATEAMAMLLHKMPPLDLPSELERERAIRALAESIQGAGNALVAWWWKNRDVPKETIVKLNSELVWNGLKNLVDPKKDQTD
ncbi:MULTISPECIES: TetR/AcrR family transcriptional regulator [Saccharothrix]|uniref:TetR/AcrR family transcriptional regulator n=1 Tax=Saccharothrix TaxID=2071 RepID=UPI0009F860EF|nr:TetR/AcrR family transcriptional regulator [Saccharothrix sp. CB00851]